MSRNRCKWASEEGLLQVYHDNEYGKPVKEDDVLFERLMLEIYQAGLTWKLVLERREGFNEVFYGFNLKKVSKMSDDELLQQLNNEKIIRNRLKLFATRHNAGVILDLIKTHGSFFSYLKKLPYKYKNTDELKQCTKIMKKDGFKFIGPLILEEFFYSIGLNPVKHEKTCFLYNKN